MESLKNKIFFQRVESAQTHTLKLLLLLNFYNITMVKSALFLPLLLSGAAAFAPSAPSTIQRTQIFVEAAALEVDEDTTTSTDPFDTYEATKEQRTIAIRDVSTGSGYAVGETDDQLLRISFTSKFVGNKKKTANIKEFDVDSMVFKTGETRCLPGLEEGLKGMKIGGSRLVKVPPNKGYRDNWYRGVVPPNSHLQFDVTLEKIAQSPIEEAQMKLEKFGYERFIGASVCFAYFVFSPYLEKIGVLPHF